MEDIFYDYTNDTLGNNKKYLDTKGIERYLEYRLSSNKRKDPDGYSKKLQDIYIKKFYESTVEKVYSDTMTSCQTLISNFYKKYSSEWETYTKIFRCPRAKGLSNANMKDMLNNKDFPIFNEIFNSNNKEYECIRTFIDRYHTIGNYIPVAKDFNANRSHFGKDDMWDISLIRIKEYFENRNEKVLIELVNANNYKPTKEWLDKYKSYDDFVEKYKLQFYKKHEDEFAKLHSLENTIPDSKEKFLKYFKLLNDAIEVRAKEITK